MEDEKKTRKHAPHGAMGFWHPNGRGTGSAMHVALRPATSFGNGCIAVSLAKQKTVGDGTAEPPTLPMYDWMSQIEMRLGPVEVAEVLLVLNGYAEGARDGRGFFHRDLDGAKAMTLSRVVEPSPRYRLEMTRRTGADEPERVTNAAVEEFVYGRYNDRGEIVLSAEDFLDDSVEFDGDAYIPDDAPVDYVLDEEGRAE